MDTLSYYDILVLAVPITIAIAYVLYRHGKLRYLFYALGIISFVYLYATKDRQIETVVVEKEVFVQAEKTNIEKELNYWSNELSIPSSLVSVILEKESGGKMNSIRFESHYMNRAGKLTNNKDEQRMYASSHCAMQVMGTLAHSYGYKWSDLYDPAVCAEVSLKYLKKCLSKHSGAGKYQQIKNAYKCYNGGDAYANDAIERLSKAVFEKVF